MQGETHAQAHTHSERKKARADGGRERERGREKPPEAKLPTPGLDRDQRLRLHTEPAWGAWKRPRVSDLGGSAVKVKRKGIYLEGGKSPAVVHG